MDYTVKMENIKKEAKNSFVKKFAAYIYETFEFCAPAIITMNGGYYVPDTDSRK